MVGDCITLPIMAGVAGDIHTLIVMAKKKSLQPRHSR